MPVDFDFEFWERVADFWNPVQSARLCVSDAGPLPFYKPSAESLGTKLLSLEETEETSGGLAEEMAVFSRLGKGESDE